MPHRDQLPAALRTPHPRRLDRARPDYDEITSRHIAAIEAGEGFYIDPRTGLWVMTAAKLWERPCCQNLCRHCPWLDLEQRLGEVP